MGIDPSQPNGEGPEQSSPPTKDNNQDKGVGGISDADWDALFNLPVEEIDPLPRELKLVPDGVVGEHIEAEVRDALERRMPDTLVRRAMPNVLGETKDGRVVISLEFRRSGGSLIPAAQLVEGPDPSEPGGFRGSRADPKKKIVTTIAGNGALDSRDWEEVPGQVTVILTQRYPGQSSDGFTMQLKANSMSVVENMFHGIEEKDRKDKPSAARYLLDRHVAERLFEVTGERDISPDFILITPLSKLEDGVGKLSVVVAVNMPGRDSYHALEGTEIEVSLSKGKLISVTGGTWYDRGPAELYVKELERRELKRRGGAD
ncbi:MAG: hypothetical protein RL417_2026 [Pseudomonadota bacterium]|jgi:hypothetical protein